MRGNPQPKLLTLLFLGVLLTYVLTGRNAQSQSAGNVVSTTVATCSATAVPMVLTIAGTGLQVIYMNNTQPSGGQTLGSITDTRGSTCSSMNIPQDNRSCNPNNVHTELWWCHGGSAGSDTFTVHLNTGTAPDCKQNLLIQDFANMLSPSQGSPDGRSLGNSTGPLSLTITPDQASNLAVAMAGFSTTGNTRTAGPTSSFTEITPDMSFAGTSYMAYLIQNSSTPLIVGWTGTNADCWAVTAGDINFTAPSPTATPTVTATLTPTPTVTVTATATITATSTNTPVGTATPTPTPTTTATPTTTPTPTQKSGSVKYFDSFNPIM